MTQNFSVDGMHLTQEGALEMAQEAAKLISAADEAEIFNLLRVQKDAILAHMIKAVSAECYVAVRPLLFHWSLIIGNLHDTSGYMDGWCYADQKAAERAFDEWDGKGEPCGWHRHPRSGRRRPDGDINREYYQP